MAIPANLITWSNLQVSKKDNIFAKIGIGIEDRSGTLTDGLKETVLDVSIWFQANKNFSQEKGHVLTINGVEKEILPINANPNESTIIYFETISFDKAISGYLNEDGIEMQDIILSVILSNINNFAEDFTVIDKKTAITLASYSVDFIQQFADDDTEVLDLFMKKYYNHSLYLYKNDFQDYMDIIREDGSNYKLLSIVNNNINFKYDLQERQSKVIEENNNLSFTLIYEKIEHKLIFNGNGGFTDAEETEVIKDNIINVSQPLFKRDGYVQNGWSYSPSIYGEIIDINNIPRDRDIVIYAKWKRQDVTITYYNNITDVNISNMPTSKTFKSDENIMISDIIPQADKIYTFLRWKDNQGNYYYPEENLSIFENLDLYAEWQEKKYTVQYILPNNRTITNNFIKGYGVVQGVMTSDGDDYQYFSYAIDDYKPDKTIGDSLEDGDHTLYAMTYNEVQLIYYYSDKTYTEIKKIYNHGNILKKYKPRQSMLYVINDEDGNKKFFQYWKLKEDTSEASYSPNLYYDLPLTIDSNGNAQNIEFEAVYDVNERIEHNIFITKDDGISLIAEDFNENESLTKSEYILEEEDGTEQTVNGFIFFKQGEVTATQFNETNEEVNYNIGSKETGIFNFNNYIQETRLKKQLLQISLKELDDNGLGYVVLDDATEASTNDDIYISL